jgi:dipeptidyl aminopeptidase/acylaminoacyl peptidase
MQKTKERRMNRIRNGTLFWIIVATASSCGVFEPRAFSDAKRSISEMDLFRFVWIADPQLSPDGSRIAFVRVRVNRERDRYETALWTVAVDGGEARQFTSGPYDLSPRWSPDGKQIAFLRAVEKEGKLQPAQLYLIQAGGGEAQSLTEIPRGAGSHRWSPDGKSIAFTSSASAEDLAQKKAPAVKESETAPKRESDVRVITQAVYRFNDAGYLDPKRPRHIWTVAVPGGSEPKQVTSGSFSEQNPAWSPDGKDIYFTSNRVKEPYYDPPDTDIYAIPSGGGEMKKVLSIDGTIGDFSFSPDGKLIAFRGTANGRPARSYSQPDLFVADAIPGATPRNLTATYDFDVGSGLTADQHPPRANQAGGVLWDKDGRALITVVAEQGRANLKRIDATSGTVEPLTTGDHEIVSYAASSNASRLAALVSSATSIGDLFLLDGATRKMTQVTRFNDALFSGLELSAPEEIWYTSFDGKKIHGWIQKPPDFNPAKKYPMILEIHGGPHAAYGHTFTHEFHWMAAKGYVVLYTNPRGSSSYGQDFGNIIQYRYPGDDFKDLMAGVDDVLKRGYVDPERLGVTGGSGGGLLTNWVVTQTGRFRAAVAQRSIADWAGFWYTADFTLFTPTWFKGAPWQEAADFAARSPITHVSKVTTPLMFIEGESDYRTPPSEGGEAMFRALKYLRKPTALVRFPDETHELSRSGKPWHRVERLQHILNWFDKYLQGKSIDLYEVP